MPDLLKVFEECRDSKCNDLFTEKELGTAKKEYIKSYNKNCGKEKDVKKQTRCTINVLTKSKYNKLLKRKRSCAIKKCKKEHDEFLEDFRKSMKAFKNRMKKKKSKKQK